MLNDVLDVDEFDAEDEAWEARFMAAEKTIPPDITGVKRLKAIIAEMGYFKRLSGPADFEALRRQFVDPDEPYEYPADQYDPED